MDISQTYLAAITAHLGELAATQTGAIEAAATRLAQHIQADQLVYVYGPGGHSNLASQEVFFRAGGLMHISAILDEGTLLSGGALRSMAIERTPGYGRIVIDDQGLGEGDLLILVNAYGINAALIDAALRARELGVSTIGVSSRAHADQTSPDHPARHPSKQNLHQVVDLHIDTQVPVGDALLPVDGVGEPMGAISTFANAYTMQWLVMATAQKLVAAGSQVPVWRSGNAPGGDEANAQFLDRFRSRVRWL